ncbi:probable F420-dependent oxidoreductase, Rv3520c family [Saccharopolyspora kobensis]|uniref:Probable F420-dependent oxidoreductase, Rv3520c family n=1 Tax=Saccharopolyspora kobensis TaxID=146035 RepID=A0A1H6EGW8_9PSEU|nr:LLM class F420-dependent oxidoreductase [Saccharopolyspora kobensis]SEG96503.1 probable F420-dependent oxidoreductase, Rv3520c family [Saccharopolyspora kobensis]SFF06897.1 probable F420-dependent oxidoreductase, Rv3520c family [Saccharopolyspora kobensis]
MRIGLQLGYWGAAPPPNAEELVLGAESAGFDSVFAAESWGSDAFTPLAWWGSRTSRVRLGTSVAQVAARTPASCAMHALTLDHLSGGRCVLGLGVSGPQVVEGWYGTPFAKPLARTREYVSIVRQVLAREAPVRNEGAHYRLPYDGPGSIGLGKSLRPITHPLRADLPIWLGAEGPRNVAQTAEIADGWIAVYYSPRVAGMYEDWLAEGFARPGARRGRADFEVAASCQVVVTDDPAAERAKLKPSLALYIGGMGAPGMNFHAELFRRMDYGEVVDDVLRLYGDGRREEAVAAVPDEMVDDVAVIGDAETVRARVAEWEKSGVDTLLVGCRSVDHIRRVSTALGLGGG